MRDEAAKLCNLPLTLDSCRGRENQPVGGLAKDSACNKFKYQIFKTVLESLISVP